MSNTSAPVPPRLGATPFLYSSVLESKTATLATLPRTAPLRCSTREKRPPSQMLVPTCSIALTRPSIMGVSSGFSDGNARTVPPAIRRTTAAESNNKSVLLIPISFFSRAEEESMKTPHPVTQPTGIISSHCQQAYRPDGTSSESQPHKPLARTYLCPNAWLCL